MATAHARHAILAHLFMDQAELSIGLYGPNKVELSFPSYRRQTVMPEADLSLDGDEVSFAGPVDFGVAGESWGEVAYVGILSADRYLLILHRLDGKTLVGKGDRALFNAGDLRIGFQPEVEQ